MMGMGGKTECPPLCFPSIFFDEVQGGREAGNDWGGGKGERGQEQGEVCWSSCVLAISGRGVVGIGQV